MAVSTRGDDADFEVHGAKLTYPADGAGVGLDPVGFHGVVDQFVLAMRELVHRIEVGGVLGFAARESDAASVEKTHHAVMSRLAVDVPFVIGDAVEGEKRGGLSRGVLLEERVKGLFPRGGVQGGCGRQDTVEIE